MKWYTALIAPALALLLATAGAVLAQSGPEIPWWVIAGGGADGESGTVVVDDTLGQPVAGASAADNLMLDAGYRQQLFPPAAVTGLAASVASTPEGRRLRLDWTAVGHDAIGHPIGGVTYNLYRAPDAPYFAPGGAYQMGWPDSGFTDGDGSVLTNAGHGMYYVVEAGWSGLTGGRSGRVGAFVFSLTPGG